MKTPTPDQPKISQADRLVAGSKTLRSETTYELVCSLDSDGSSIPALLGRGRFAKVYKAWQRSAGHNVRPVAIKILHENIDRRSEQLFHSEIGLLKKLSSANGVNVVSVLDILQLGPMVMCGSCGQIYHPRCPQCGEHLLERFDPPQDAFPALRCRNHTRCKYIVSGEHILNSAHMLMQPTARTCCSKDRGPRTNRGTLINFVDRDAVVMELMDQGLLHFHDSRRRTYSWLCKQHGILLPGPKSATPASGSEPQISEAPLAPLTAEQTGYIQKVMLLEKTLLMVQLAEALAWLHGEEHIIHKDISPDNIMIRSLNEEPDSEQDWRGLGTGGLGDALITMATYPRFSAQVIDFGLADQVRLTRNWYEEPVQSFAAEKISYLSLEAQRRKRRLQRRIEFDVPGRRFLVPEVLRPDKAGELSIKVGDLLIDESDPRQMYCLTITSVDPDPQDGHTFWATFTGDPPPNPQSRQFDLLLPLGEPHDVYALGAVFFFIITGDHTEVGNLANIAANLQAAPQPLRGDQLMRSTPLYGMLRDRLPEKFYSDELMTLCLRAMVRGQPESFAESRVERGSAPALKLLQETRRIYNQLKSEILSSQVLHYLHDLNSVHNKLRADYGTLQMELGQQGQLLHQLRVEYGSLQGEHVRAQESLRRRQRLLMAVGMMACLGGVGSGYGWHRSSLVPAAHESTVQSLGNPGAESPRR